ncbi:MAG TPA: Ppx/GppA phosphatase family protein [Rhizomicrobium sp.]|nr:Ppx/GppA phosphatase family protein [Rhizomicrobium sp.]
MAEGTRRRRRGGRHRGAPPLVAALDLGTNNCRLLIARSSRGGDLRVVDSFSRIVRLGEGVAQSGLLSEAAIERTVEALKICARHLAAKGVSRLRAVATEACRRAANADVLLARARAEAGLALEIISAEEEARLAAIGCAPLIDGSAEGALIFDIGGGSTEIIWMRRAAEGAVPRVVASASEPVGVVTLSESGGAAGYAAMRAAMIDRFAAVKGRFDGIAPFEPAGQHLLGTSGTVTTLAAVALGLPRYERARVDASWHRCSDIAAVIDRLVNLDLKGRAAMGAIGADRADLIVPGCAIFAGIAASWPCARLRVADRGLREGILRELMGRTPAERP